MLNSVDILIVGAGPVGLNIALALAQQNIQCRVVDNKSGPATTSNAIGVNARTLEIWQTMGFADEAIERGLKLKSIKLFSKGKLLNQAPFDKIESEFNFMLALPQAQTEALLIEQLAKHDIEVEWNTKLTNIEDGADKVSLVCQNGDTIEEITAKWVIGCDGYHSSVRELGKFERRCNDSQQHFFMMDAQLEGGITSSNDMSVVFHNSGVLLFFPMRDKIRVVAEISNDAKYKNVAEPTREIFIDILNERCPGVTISSSVWLSKFYIHECIVSNFKKGHVFLAGDAAHSHSPAGGQGMNTGIQDSWNLAWKLAQVVKQEADPKLLDTYNLERLGIAHDVLKRSGGLTKVATTNNKFLQLLRNLGVGGILSIDLVRHKIVNSIAQTDICYTNSPLIDSDQVLYQNRTRYPITNNKWLLLSKDLLISPDLPTFVSVEQNPLYWSDQPLCLIRPDGYIAIYADSVFEINSYFIENGIEA